MDARTHLLERPLAILPARLRSLVSVDSGYEREPDEIEDRGSTAVVRVSGPLFSRGDWLANALGFVNYESLGSLLEALDAAPDCQAIVLDFDSPGGDVIGMFELAEKVAALETKTIAVASGGAYSAAYALASACDEIYVSRAGGVGSVGVVAAHVDNSGALRDAGQAVSFVYAGAKKVDGNPTEPLSDRARADLQAEVDRLYGMFVEHVAKSRGLSADAVRATEAGTYHGELAVEAGLADRVGTVEDAVASLTNHSPFGARRPWPGRRSA